jgi:hypothetical protein
MRGGALGPVLAGALALACAKQQPTRAAPSASASASAAKPAPALPAPVASGLPDPQTVSAQVNPNQERTYDGPVGTVRGRVIVTGDTSVPLPDALEKIPPTCPASAREVHGTLFREGPGRTLADALVAVTGYKGYVPEREPVVRVEAKGCAYSTRTLAMTYGQRIEVASMDQETYVPELLGERGQPQILAMPGNQMVSPLYPTRPGRFVLIDNLKLFMTAQVMVVKFSTHAVTGVDGRFEIKNVPVGPVNVNALLPVTGVGAQKNITVEAGKPTEELVFEIPFDAKAFRQSLDGGAPAPSASGKAPRSPASIPKDKPSPAPARSVSP